MEIMDFAGPLVLVTILGLGLRSALKHRHEQSKLPIAMAPVMHCMTCGEDSQRPANASAVKRGNATLEIVLWVFLLWPIAIVYSVWRRIGQGAKSTCPVCNAATLIPATSPAARAHRRQLYPDAA